MSERRSTGQSECGSVMVWFLAAVPALVAALALSFEMTQLTHTADWFQEGLNRSAKGAALQITPASYAEGAPHILRPQAEAAFRRLLADNLALDPTTLAPTSPYGRVVAVTYGFWVCPDECGDLQQVRDYPDSSTPNFPVAISEAEPGVITMVAVQFNAAVTHRVMHIRRWAFAKVVSTTSP